jgi:hypothetical protein
LLKNWTIWNWSPGTWDRHRKKKQSCHKKVAVWYALFSKSYVFWEKKIPKNDILI